MKIVVAIKDISNGDIRPGKILGKFRKLEFARRAFNSLVRQTGKRYWEIGVFKNGNLIN